MIHYAPFLLATLLGCIRPDAKAMTKQTPLGTAETAAPADSTQSLIPVGTVRATSMDLVAPPRLQELMRRFQATAQRDPQWWMEYVKANARPGEPLPYHPNLGLSEAEYREMLGMSDEMRLAPVGEGELTVRTEGDSRYVLDGGRAFPDLTGIAIDLARNRVETPLGVLTPGDPIEPSPGQAATGPWHGVRWELEDFDPDAMTGTVVKLSLGRLEESGRGILHYDARRMADGKLQTRVVRVLTYELPMR